MIFFSPFVFFYFSSCFTFQFCEGWTGNCGGRRSVLTTVARLHTSHGEGQSSSHGLCQAGFLHRDKRDCPSIHPSIHLLHVVSSGRPVSWRLRCHLQQIYQTQRKGKTQLSFPTHFHPFPLLSRFLMTHCFLIYGRCDIRGWGGELPERQQSVERNVRIMANLVKRYHNEKFEIVITLIVRCTIKEV